MATKKPAAKKAVKKTAVTSKKFPTAAEAKKTAAANPRPANTPRVKGTVNKVASSKPFTSGKVASAAKAAAKVGRVAKFARGASAVGLGLTALDLLTNKKPVSSKTSDAKPKYTAGDSNYKTGSGAGINKPKPTAKQTAAQKAETDRENRRSTKPATAPVAKKTDFTVTVKKGDTLSGIAAANKTTVKDILKANPVVAKRKADGKVDIFSGTKIRIPKK